MPTVQQFSFPPFRLDLVNQQLWHEATRVPIRPKAFAVLRCLLEQAGRLVTKAELMKEVWPETRVSDGVLKGYIRDLRDMLGDDAQQPRFIETVPRRGHRFIGNVVSQDSEVRSQEEPRGARLETGVLFPTITSPQPLVSNIVGREAEFARLHSLFTKALSCERQIVFVTGEPGIGKTTLVESFLKGLGTQEGAGSAPPLSSRPSPSPSLDPGVWVGRGQCVEQHGAGEAYLPVLEALGRIGRAPGGDAFVAILQQSAPTWLVQMPTLLPPEELESVRQRALGATRERMLRELVEAMDALAEKRPVVLWLEDLHWADASTVDWLAAIAQRHTPARLMIIGTYRPADLTLHNHPLRAVKQELVAKRQCEELWLPFLTTADVAQYLTRRYGQHDFPAELGVAIHQRTDGNPLFVITVIEYLEAQGVIASRDNHWGLQTTTDEVRQGVPDSLRQLIEMHLERLSEAHQRLLEVASVAGVTFTATAVAAGMDVPVEHVEKCCDELVLRGQFLRAQEPRLLPNGTLCGSYEFQHALQHAVVYDRLPHLRRERLHRRVGDGEEQSYGTRAHEIAAELAMHFELGNELPRAVQYRQYAGHNALRQHGYQEAITHFTRGLDLLGTFPDAPERRQQELALQVALGSPLQALHGYGAPEVETVYTRARELSQQIGETSQLFPILRGLYVFYVLRGKIQTAYELGERLLSLAQSGQNPALLLEAHFALGQALLFKGELSAARAHFADGIALYDPAQHRSHAFLYGQDPGVFCRVLAAWDLCFLGYPDLALRMNQEGLAVAQEVAHPLSLAAAEVFFALTHQFRREGRAAQEHAEAAIRLCAQQGLPFFLGLGTVMLGWARAEQGDLEEGITQMRQALTAYQATGAELPKTRIIALLAEALGKVGQLEEGLTLLADAIAAVDNGAECDYEAELYRLKGTLALQSQTSPRQVPDKSQTSQAYQDTSKVDLRQSAFSTPKFPEAEACFLKAIGIARQQQAKALELRAVMSLVRLRQHQTIDYVARNPQPATRDQLAEAHKMLADVYNRFTEGFDLKDLQEAKALLEELAHWGLAPAGH